MRGIIRTCRVSSFLILIRCSSTTPTVTSYGVSDIWKRKGGMGARSDDNGDSKKWIKHDFQLHNFLKENIPEALVHTGEESFDEHLKGVQSVLRSWNAETDVSDAGLFHSLYGTQGFQGYKLPFKRRADIRKMIGPRAERLVWIFCVVDRASVDRTLFQEGVEFKSNYGYVVESDPCLDRKLRFTSREELGCFIIHLKDEEAWLDFLELSLADWLEQVQGAAEKENPFLDWKEGEAWSYRRKAYQQMAKILAEKRGPRLLKALEMCNEIYAQEPIETRHMNQVDTAPVSEAAKEAREAILSIGL